MESREQWGMGRVNGENGEEWKEGEEKEKNGYDVDDEDEDGKGKEWWEECDDERRAAQMKDEGRERGHLWKRLEVSLMSEKQATVLIKMCLKYGEWPKMVERFHA